MERQFENRNLKLENCDIPPQKNHFFRKPNLPPPNALSANPACQSITQPTSNRSHPSIPPGLRHGDLTHNTLSATLACQTRPPSTLRHGDPAHKGFSATPACQSISQPTSNRSHPSIPPGLRHGDLTHNTLSAILAEPL